MNNIRSFFIPWVHRIHTSTKIIFHFRFNHTNQTTSISSWLLWVVLTARISTSLYWYLFLSFFYQLINKSAFKKGVGMAIYSIGFTLRTRKMFFSSFFTAIGFTLRTILGSPCVQANVCITNYFLFPIITPHICIGLHWC